MGIEVATFISDFVPANPSASDNVSQGDDHIRLVKQVEQNTFPNASKAFYFPTGVGKSANFTVLAADMHKTFGVDTGAGAPIVMTLPTLGAGAAGWECTVIKFSGTAPILVTPASGTVQSGGLAVAAARRSVPGVPYKCFWTGVAWNISRATGLPVGVCVEFHGAALPQGYEWPSGQTLASAAANYPEYVAVFGSGATLDKRGRVGVTLDNLGGAAAGRLAGGVITGTAVGNTGGTDTVTLGLLQIPTGIASAVTVTSLATTVVGNIPISSGGISSLQTQGAATTNITPNTSGGSWSGITSLGGTGSGTALSNNTGGGAHSNLSPSIMVSEILVVE